MTELGSPSIPMVLAVGSLMLDTMARVDALFLEAHGLPMGDATPIADVDSFGQLKADAIAASTRPAVQGCGGCAANSAKVLACLGCDVAFCGVIGNDSVGAVLRGHLGERAMRDFTVEGSETGEVLCLVTPEGERTFAYRSGASATLTWPMLASALSKQAGVKLVYFDIYTLLNPETLLEDGMRETHTMGGKTGLNLGTRGIVASQASRLWDILREGLCDVVMMNHEEAIALCSNGAGIGGSSAASLTAEAASPLERGRECCAVVAAHCELTVVTLGIDGLWVSVGKGACPVLYNVARCDEIVDSTGAGDFFAGGFLSAWLLGKPASECVRWGAAAAVAVLRVFGTDLGEGGWAAVRAACSRETDGVA